MYCALCSVVCAVFSCSATSNRTNLGLLHRLGRVCTAAVLILLRSCRGSQVRLKGHRDTQSTAHTHTHTHTHTHAHTHTWSRRHPVVAARLRGKDGFALAPTHTHTHTHTHTTRAREDAHLSVARRGRLSIARLQTTRNLKIKAKHNLFTFDSFARVENSKKG